MASEREPAQPTVWPVLHYEDPAGALRFLIDAFGFREALAVRDDDGDVVHAELRWPQGGAVVLGSTKHSEGVHGGIGARAGACYVVADDVDGVHRQAVRANAEIVERPHDTAFGSGVGTRAFTARDPEGNLWTFGTYRGAP
ncbi:MAG: VOC family protein [Solirubrobacteraceae bacterium]